MTTNVFFNIPFPPKKPKVTKNPYEKTIHEAFPFIYDPSCKVCAAVRAFSAVLHKEAFESGDFEIEIKPEIKHI